MNIATIEVSGVYASAKAYTHIPAGLVGATVVFEFTDPRWDSLSKTAVFRGNVTRDVIMSGDIVRLPPETVETPGGRLLIGVYGVDSDENIVIPTLWTDIGPIRAAADPSGDPGVDPELPVWAQLQDEIEKLKQNTPEGPDVPGQDGGYYTPSLTQPDDNTLEFQWTPSKPGMPAVEPVQVELPTPNVDVDLTGVVKSVNGQTPDESGNVEIHIPETDSNGGFVAQDNPPEGTSLLWIDTDDDSDDGFQEAVNTVLAQAKASGEFDGAPGQPGKDGKDYVLTPADKTEIAELASELVEVPESSGGISVTGAHVGQTIKIAAVDENGVPTAWESVDFPSGGEEAKEWEEFMRFTTDNAETTVFDFSSNGTETLESKKVKEFYIYSPAMANTGCGIARVLVNDRVNITGLTDFGRASNGSMKLDLFASSNSLDIWYFGRDSNYGLDGGASGISCNSIGAVEKNGLLEVSINAKNAWRKIYYYHNGIPFPRLSIDYIKSVVVTTSDVCSSGVEFIVYVR